MRGIKTQQKAEHPIIFSTDMVKAILDGTKTMTRRVLKPQPDLGLDPFESYSHIEVGKYHPALVDKDGELYPGDEIFGAYTDDGEWGWKCSYGQVEDRLGVKETHYRYGRWIKNGYTKTGKQAWKFFATTGEVRYFDDRPFKLYPGKNREWVSERKYSEWYKRPSIFLPKKYIRTWLEITDIRAERVQEITYGDCMKEGLGMSAIDYRPGWDVSKFKELWDSLNAKRGYDWEANPFVWVISFKVVS